MAAAAEAAMAAATSGSTGSYCRGQMPRVDDEQKGAKRKKKRQEIEEQKKTFSPVFLSGKRRRPPIGCRPTFFRGNDQPITEPTQRRDVASVRLSPRCEEKVSAPLRLSWPRPKSADAASWREKKALPSAAWAVRRLRRTRDEATAGRK